MPRLSLLLVLLLVACSGPAPADPVAALGTFAPADEIVEGADPIDDPVFAVEEVTGGMEADSRTVEVVSETADRMHVLATFLGLGDDSVRDERLLFTFTSGPGGWTAISAGRQVRCQPNRGHADWGPALCL